MEFTLVGAIVGGLVATAVFTIMQAMARAMEMTKMNIVNLLGTMFGPKGSSTATFMGWGAHILSGVTFGIIYGAIFTFFGETANFWLVGGLIGLVHGVIVGGLVMPMMGVIHPRVADGTVDAPGVFGKNLGSATPVGILVLHTVFGAILGGVYRAF